MTSEDRPSARPELRAEGVWEPDFFRALSDRHRRFVLYFLLEHEAVSVEELADVLAGWLYAGEGTLVGRRERDLIHASLVHRHLDAMESAQLVAVDRDAGSVARTDWSPPVRETVELALDAESDSDRP